MQLVSFAERAPECRLRNSKWYPSSLNYSGLSAVRQKPHGVRACLPVALSQGKGSLRVTGTTKPHSWLNRNQLDHLCPRHMPLSPFSFARAVGFGTCQEQLFSPLPARLLFALGGDHKG